MCLRHSKFICRYTSASISRFPDTAVNAEVLKWSISALVHRHCGYYVCILD